GVKLPDLDISVVHRSDGSGTSFIFTSYLQAVSPDWKAVGAGTSVNWPTGAGQKGSEGVAGLVKQTPGGIGYFELAYSTTNNITTASMQNKAGKFVVPSPASASADAAGAPALPTDLRGVIVDGSGDAAYPISGFSWVVINQNQSDANVAQSITHLLWWATHDGQKFSEALQYAPLPAPIVTLDEAQLKKVTSGGKPVLATP
ncbi:MAG: substrate-binding domain-containing protein, partial [Dehalococcoidia bacterium]